MDREQQNLSGKCDNYDLHREVKADKGDPAERSSQAGEVMFPRPGSSLRRVRCQPTLSAGQEADERKVTSAWSHRVKLKFDQGYNKKTLRDR